MGICGTGMAALAGLLLEKGFVVKGSDSQAYPPMSDLLRDMKIPVSLGYSAENLQPEPDFVIIGNVIRRDNPEALAVMERSIPYMSFPQAISHLCLQGRRSLVAAGTHGKTTTATLLAAALRGTGADPGFMIGGVPLDFGTGFHVGSPPWFVLEGDEYDTAFFDKQPKFLHYRPYGLILTSIEFDHADIYQDLGHIRDAFARLVRIVDPEGLIVACRDWPVVREVCQNAPCRVITYGAAADDAMWHIGDLRISGGKTSFSACLGDEVRMDLEIWLPGLHNALNGLGVAALCYHLGLSPDGVRQGLASCAGAKRRQEVIGEINGITVIDDFAHHPTAVRETLKALREKYTGRRLIAVFEPRTNTSTRAVFQRVYPGSFESADLILVREVPYPEKAPEGDRFSSERLVEDLRGAGRDAHYFMNAGEILDYLTGEAGPGDVIAIMSNGDFEGLHQKLITALKNEYS